MEPFHEPECSEFIPGRTAVLFKNKKNTRIKVKFKTFLTLTLSQMFFKPLYEFENFEKT